MSHATEKNVVKKIFLCKKVFFFAKKKPNIKDHNSKWSQQFDSLIEKTGQKFKKPIHDDLGLAV